DEVTGPVIAIALVLCAVFVPTAFMAGISGQFYKQVALTIAASTVISAFNSLTLSPALGALMLKPPGHRPGHAAALPQRGTAIIGALLVKHFLFAPAGHMFGIDVGGHGHAPTASAAALWGLTLGLWAVGILAGYLVAGIVNKMLGAFFKGFNKAFDVSIAAYG